MECLSEEDAVHKALTHAGVSQQDIVSKDQLGIHEDRSSIGATCYYRLRQPGNEVEEEISLL